MSEVFFGTLPVIIAPSCGFSKPTHRTVCDTSYIDFIQTGENLPYNVYIFFDITDFQGDEMSEGTSLEDFTLGKSVKSKKCRQYVIKSYKGYFYFAILQ